MIAIASFISLNKLKTQIHILDLGSQQAGKQAGRQAQVTRVLRNHLGSGLLAWSSDEDDVLVG